MHKIQLMQLLICVSSGTTNRLMFWFSVTSLVFRRSTSGTSAVKKLWNEKLSLNVLTVCHIFDDPTGDGKAAPLI